MPAAQSVLIQPPLEFIEHRLGDSARGFGVHIGFGQRAEVVGAVEQGEGGDGGAGALFDDRGADERRVREGEDGERCEHPAPSPARAAGVVLAADDVPALRATSVGGIDAAFWFKRRHTRKVVPAPGASAAALGAIADESPGEQGDGAEAEGRGDQGEDDGHEGWYEREGGGFHERGLATCDSMFSLIATGLGRW